MEVIAERKYFFSGYQSTFCRKDASVNIASCRRKAILAWLSKIIYIIQWKLLLKYLFYTLTHVQTHTEKFWKIRW